MQSFWFLVSDLSAEALAKADCVERHFTQRRKEGKGAEEYVLKSADL
jgi:hypothetical protein